MSASIKNCESLWQESGANTTALYDTHYAPLLQHMLEHSQHLCRLTQQHPSIVIEFIEHSADACWQGILEKYSIVSPSSRPHMMQQLRNMKQEAALCIAMAELSQAWPLLQVTKALSDLADIAMNNALHCMWQEWQQQSLVCSNTPLSNSGISCIAMGKWGSKELNYSSDIDLMLLYDAQKTPWQSSLPIQSKMNQLGRDVISLLQDRTADGYVFRTDLRLRPDPSSTPLVMNSDAILTYYETVGQHWERAALIKARAAAGDAEVGHYILNYLTPFIWRKSLDLDMIDDIAAIKRQIDHKHGEADEDLASIHLKLGHGGIRDIEFFTQTQQLIWGGRQPSLRTAQTCKALSQLAQLEHIPADTANNLANAYEQLRRWEHGVQMLEDAQRHNLPHQADNQAHLAKLLGASSEHEFYQTIRQTMQQVRLLTQPLFDEHAALSSSGNLAFTGIEDDPETLISLKKMGFNEPETVSLTIRRWHSGICAATQSARARELLTQQVPSLLSLASLFPEPDAILKRFDQLLRALPVGVPIFSLIQAQPSYLSQLINLFGLSPMLAEWLCRRPKLLELALAIQSEADYQQMLEQELTLWLNKKAPKSDYAAWHHIVTDFNFIAGALMVSCTVTPQQAMQLLAMQARLTIETLVSSFNISPQTGWAILAVGKLADHQLTLTSDIDMLAIDNGSDAASKAAQACMKKLKQAMGAKPWGQQSWELDMRMRPHGDSGPLSMSLDTADNYYRTQAWSYEKLALSRLSFLVGDRDFSESAIHTISQAISAKPISRHDSLTNDIMELRHKLQQHIPDLEPYSTKHKEGGMLDLEWAGQSWLLTHSPSQLPAAPLHATLRTDPNHCAASLACADLLQHWHIWQMIHRCMDMRALLRDTTPALEPWHRMLQQYGFPHQEQALHAHMQQKLSEGHLIFQQLLEMSDN